MQLFLDSANLDQIREAVSWGAIDGVTTNPSLVAKEGRGRGMLVNVVDVPELCNFYVNAQVRRGDLTISVSTGTFTVPLAGEKLATLGRVVSSSCARVGSSNTPTT